MYLRYLVVTTLLVLAVISSINYFVDPAYVYRSVQDRSDTFAEKVFKSEHGLWWPDTFLPERAIKKSLSTYADQAACVVIGSSHVMQIGSSRSTNSLVGECASIINLSVSGASIEDHFALTYLALQNKRAKKIILGIDPWTLAYGKDARWSYYSRDYRQARNVILGETVQVDAENADTTFNKLRNLLSMEYTVKSVHSLVLDLRKESFPYYGKSAPKLNEAIGGKYPIYFQDGSFLYDGEYIASTRPLETPLGGITYMTDGELNNLSAISAYKSLLNWVKKNGAEPILLLTPYHQNVWKDPDSINARALVATETVVRKIAGELGLTVIGTYNPDTAGCLSTEFFDFMHPTSDCLAKLR